MIKFNQKSQFISTFFDSIWLFRSFNWLWSTLKLTFLIFLLTFVMLNWHFQSIDQHFWSFNQNMVKNDQKLQSSFNRYPIFVVRFKLGRNWRSNSDGLESELLKIQFRNPNCLNLVWTSSVYLHLKNSIVLRSSLVFCETFPLEEANWKMTSLKIVNHFTVKTFQRIIYNSTTFNNGR